MTQQPSVDIHTDHDWIGKLSPGLRAEVEGLSQSRQCPRGTVLFQPGAHADESYTLASGRVHMLLIAPDGREFHADTIVASGSIGVLGCIEKRSHMFSALVAEDSEILALPGPALRRLYETKIEVAHALSRLYASRFRSAMHTTYGAIFLSPRDRLMQLFLRLAHYEEGDAPGAVIGPISHEGTARMLGVTRQTVGKEIAALRRDGLIASRYKYVTLIDPQAMLLEIQQSLWHA